MHRLLALLVPLAVLASCGNGDGDDGAAAGATSTTSRTPTTVADAGEDEGMGDAVLAADLDGSGPVPGPGHAEATGRFEAELVEGTLCVDLVVTGLDPAATGAHLHRGAAGEEGTVVVDLGPPSSTGDGTSTWADACTDVDDAAIDDLAAAPEGHHVDVHSGSFPDGALRGQLGVISIFDRTLD